MIPINQILSIAFESAKREMLHGKPWVSDAMNQRDADGRIHIQPLGSVVPFGGVEYPIFQAMVPLVWSVEDDRTPEHQRITLVKNLIQNGLTGMDDLLQSVMGDTSKLIVSTTYRYWLSPTLVELDNALSRSLQTAYAVVPGGASSSS